MSITKSYDVKVVVVSCWYGKVDADTAPHAEEAARAAFDDGELKQCMEEMIHVDVRPALKTYEVLYAVEQGFTVSVDAATAEDAEARVKRQLDEDHAVVFGSKCGHFDGTVIQAKEVMP
jgi:hypothetical protein